MITSSQAIQKALSWCSTYNIDISTKTSLDIVLIGHKYFITINMLDKDLKIEIDKETGGIINDIVF